MTGGEFLTEDWLTLPMDGGFPKSIDYDGVEIHFKKGSKIYNSVGIAGLEYGWIPNHHQQKGDYVLCVYDARVWWANGGLVSFMLEDERWDMDLILQLTKTDIQTSSFRSDCLPEVCQKGTWGSEV